MNKFYFKHRNCGTDPDTNKYYFSSIDELMDQVDVLNDTQNRNNHIQWSVSKSNYNNNQYALMSEYWTTESRGTKTPLKCRGWFVCGYIYDDETSNNIYELFSEWEADYTNHFIERRYLTSDNFQNLSESEKEILIKDGGIILNKCDE